MAFVSKPELDARDWQLLEALQQDARQGYAELGRQVGLSAPAVAERVKRLEEAGIIAGYRAVVNPKRLGYSIDAMIRLRCDGGICARIGALVTDIPEVLECRRLAAEDPPQREHDHAGGAADPAHEPAADARDVAGGARGGRLRQDLLTRLPATFPVGGKGFRSPVPGATPRSGARLALSRSPAFRRARGKRRQADGGSPPDAGILHP